ncbi:MAG: hypothetical protein PWR08_919 [Thermoanaerobacterium sp.]|uniref:DUF6079 family protein n=1 Tax=Thermoanaerobacterium thermosaccharolyticum TaxID=1517 RepID=UPI00264A5D62|nr:hypothetical protein [Thermoanaerobacterium sp.]WHE06425.1 DUF6079 family protein [Thermoanaerobacterium thermosaccharolyticum]
MRYGDLVHYDPIETIINLKDADDEEKAAALVKSYVMSDNMAENIINICISQLQFDETIDNKGLFIVGNYGTGKSHLMSVISSIAENEKLLKFVTNDKFKDGMKRIAGKFKVLRFDIGATDMPLRDIVLSKVEENIHQLGIEYNFPHMDKVANNKDSLMEMMALFEEKYPGKGYLIVVDELFDFLKTRKEQELIKDLAFLREIGEISKSTKIRFMSGVQESLFDNPGFQFVARTILKVKDRFEQIIIKREDISYVVSERILKKDDKQKAYIRSHLEKFSSLYKNMAERMNEFVDLFPIHPAFIEVFEKIYIAEKREVLKTITNLIKNIIDEEVPEDMPGIISYDAYWAFIKDNMSMRTNPDIKDVIDKSNVIEGAILRSFPRPQYKDSAIKIINALSVYRLATGDIRTPIGITVDNIKDDLCLFIRIPEFEEDFLRTTIETIMKDIIRTVNGQFISYNQDNQQYYIDMVRVGIDYDVIIQEKAEKLDDDTLNRYYFEILLKVLDWNVKEYVPNFKIWEYSLKWLDKNIERDGYLFMGSPDERSTAQPPRDFYIYFLNPYSKDNRKYIENGKKDEVFFEFTNYDEELESLLKSYSASMILYDSSSNDGKAIYSNKADGFMKEIVKWIKTNIRNCFSVSHNGVTKRILDIARGAKREDETIKDYIDFVASSCLSLYFADKYPDYPKFKVTITRDNREDMFKYGLNYIAGQKSEHGAKILQTFDLIDNDGNITVENSRYAKYFQDMVNSLPEGKVVNHDDIFVLENEVEIDKEFRLDGEWVALILCTLVYNGEIAITVNNKKYDATMLSDLAKLAPNDIVNFSFCDRPKEIPINTLKRLMEIIGLPTGTISNPEKQVEAIKEMNKKFDELISEAHSTIQYVTSGKTIWDKLLFNDAEKKSYKDELNGFISFLNTLKRFNTPGKLRNFRYSKEEIEKEFDALKMINRIQKIMNFVNSIDAYAVYISKACLVLTDNNDWIKKVEDVKQKIEDTIKNIDDVDLNATKKDVINELINIKKEYIDIYFEEHRKHRLDYKGDEHKKKILNSSKFSNLRRLKSIDILTGSELTAIEEELGKIHSCFSLTQQDLETEVQCKYCKYMYGDKNELLVYGKLDEIENKIDELYRKWEKTLLENIETESPLIKDNINYLNDDQQKCINEFISRRSFPENIDNLFLSSIKDLLKGLDKVEIDSKEFITFITGNGPVTLDDFKNKFMKFIENKVQGKEKDKVRIIIK